MKIAPYLFFSGACEEAFKFYEKALGAKIEMKMHYQDMPIEVTHPSELQSKIAHIRMKIGEQLIMGSDVPPERFNKPQGFDINLTVDTPEEADRIFAALSEGGSVKMPIEETFWALRFGSLVDRFGIPWMVNCEKQM